MALIRPIDNVNPPASKARPDLGAIFDAHFDYVWTTLRRFGVGNADREDLVREVFMKVHRRFDEYDPSRPIRPWLFGFSYRVAADHHRLARHGVEVLGVHGEPRAQTVPVDERIEVLEEGDLLLNALQSLDLERRAMIIMHDLNDVPIPEIAERLGVPVNTAYLRLRVAHGHLATPVNRLRLFRGEL